MIGCQAVHEGSPGARVSEFDIAAHGPCSLGLYANAGAHRHVVGVDPSDDPTCGSRRQPRAQNLFFFDKDR